MSTMSIVQRAICSTALALVLTFSRGVPAGATEQAAGLTIAGLRAEEPTRLRCPPLDAGGSFAKPLRTGPAPEMIVTAAYSDDGDLVRLVGEDAAAISDLGPGDDAVLLYDTGVGQQVRGGSGADTFLLCSMKDLSVTLTLGSFSGRDAVADVVIIEAAVFADIPTGMFRRIDIFEFDRDTDRIIIHAPRALIGARRAAIELQGVRVGDVFVRIYRHDRLGTERRSFDPEEGVVYVPAGER